MQDTDSGETTPVDTKIMGPSLQPVAAHTPLQMENAHSKKD